MKPLLSELFGTFALVLAGTGVIAAGLGHAAVSLAWALTVLALVLLLGRTSAHLNPAVTLGFWRAGRFPGRRIAPYVAVQCAGALAASLLLRALFPQDPELGGTRPSIPLAWAFGLEVLMTGLLMAAALAFSGAKAAAVIGALVWAEAYWGGPLTGTPLNPARSLGPALVSGRTEHLWLYLAAPTLGAFLAARKRTPATQPGIRAK